MTTDNNLQASEKPKRSGRIRAIFAIPFFLLAMYCSFRAIQASIASRSYPNPNSAAAIDSQEDQKNWGIGASASGLAGLIISVSGRKSRKPTP